MFLSFFLLPVFEITHVVSLLGDLFFKTRQRLLRCGRRLR